MEKRFAFKCWNCNRKYTLFKAITKEQELIVQCPYCNAEAVVKLEPFKKKTKTVLKRESDSEESIGYEYDFPDVLPTEKQEEK